MSHERKFNTGDKVFWNDPDDGLSNGIYTVANVYDSVDDEEFAELDEEWQASVAEDRIYIITNEDGSEAEVPEWELEAV